MTAEKLIHIRKAAQELCCSERHIYEMIKTGRLKAVMIGPRGLRVLKDSIDAYIKKNMLKVSKR